MSTKRTQQGGWVDLKRLPRGPNGRALCRRCKTEVPKGRRSFCGGDCVHEWKIRTDPGYMRDQVFKRDKGICAVCGLDTEALQAHAITLDKSCKLDPVTLTRAPSERDLFAKRYGMPSDTRSWWEADHIVPVVEGGGECGLEGIRSLCVPCHKRVTAELKGRLAKARRPAQPDAPTLWDTPES